MRTMTVEAFCGLAEAGHLPQDLATGGEIGLTVEGRLVAVALPPSPTGAAVSMRSYVADDESAVLALWQACGLTRAWNDPRRDIARKLADDGASFFVALAAGRLVGTAMVGYDGHRGWVNYLAVDPDHRRLGIGRSLMQHAEAWLLARGCPKLNLQLRDGNAEALTFYRRLGYSPEAVVCLGKRLIDDPTLSKDA